MRFTRRILNRQRTGALLFLAGLTTAGAAASCSSDDESGARPTSDAGSDAPMNGDDASTLDARAPDASPSRDAAGFDGGPLPVVCTSPPCATSIVTTVGATYVDRAEGFCALLQDGTVACWGANGAGQLGRGEDAGTGDSPTAARVVGLADIVTLNHTCGVDKSGGVFCWGTGPYLREGAEATQGRTTERTPVKLPIPRATAAEVTLYVGCAAVDDGVLCWGDNGMGLIAPPAPGSSTTLLPPRLVDIPPGAPIRDIAIGWSVFALRADGTMLSWGRNPPLGRASSQFPDPFPAPIALHGVSSMDLAIDDACATADGIGYCWGAVLPTRAHAYEPAETRRLGRALPEAIVTPEPIVQIATTRTALITNFDDWIVEPTRWCAVGASGAVFCGGYNANGQAGDGTKDHAYEAVEVKGLPGPANQVKTTPGATCALLTNGKVYCWGLNHHGQLGSGNLKAPSLVPTEVVLP